jgi:hypothetical protein
MSQYSDLLILSHDDQTLVRAGTMTYYLLQGPPITEMTYLLQGPPITEMTYLLQGPPITENTSPRIERIERIERTFEASACKFILVM